VGIEVYVFDKTTGHHLKTVKPLTGALLYQFGYDSAGNLVTVTDATGNVTTIQRDPSEHATAIISPYGQPTLLGLDANHFLNRATDPLGKSVTFTNSNTGLLKARTDEKGNLYSYTYDGQGRLAKESDPAGGYTMLSRTDATSGFGNTVGEATAMGRSSGCKTTLNLPWVANANSSSAENHMNT
jgi:YD repeat-containing protein